MIHYHGTPFSGGDKNLMALSRRHACVSFAEPGHLAAVAELCQSFILDNGAYSAWSNGKELDVEGYADWVRDWVKHPGFDWCLMPDVIDGSEDDNARMRAKWWRIAPDLWKHSVPVWHLDEPLEILKTFCNSNPQIAFGSSGEYREIGTGSWWQRMAEAMDVVTDSDGRPRAKLHGLRMLDPTVFSHFPFSSADSTNVARSIGLDGRWNASYAPRSKEMRALIMMERIESHASASRWVGSGGGAAKNHELFG
jgi:hypothetical protein